MKQYQKEFTDKLLSPMLYTQILTLYCHDNDITSGKRNGILIFPNIIYRATATNKTQLSVRAFCKAKLVFSGKIMRAILSMGSHPSY
jgi:hypothetical protein